MVPRGAPCTDAYDDLIREFGSGAQAPYELLLTPPPGLAAAEAAAAPPRTVAAQPFFDDTNRLVRWLAQRNSSSTPHGKLVEYAWLLGVTGYASAPLLCVLGDRGGGKDDEDAAGAVWCPLALSAYETLEQQGGVVGEELRLLWGAGLAADRNQTMALGVRLPFDPFGVNGACG